MSQEFASRKDQEQLRREFDWHVTESKDGYKRLDMVEQGVTRLEAEVIGDSDTKRPSLRSELTEQMTDMKVITVRIGLALLAALLSILGVLIFDRINHPATRQDQQVNQQQR